MSIRIKGKAGDFPLGLSPSLGESSASAANDRVFSDKPVKCAAKGLFASVTCAGSKMRKAAGALALIAGVVLPGHAYAISAGDDFYEVAEDGVLTVSQPGVLVNDTGTAPLSSSLVVDVLHGSLLLQSNGSFVYTPTADYHGLDHFYYVTSNGVGTPVGANVEINVVAVGDYPVAIADTFVVAEDTNLLVNGANGVLVNDVNPDDDTIEAHLLTPPANGVLNSFNLAGAIDYQPGPNFNGEDTFTYYLTNGSKSSAPATVKIIVTPQPDAPIAVNNNFATLKNTPLTVAAPGILVDDSDADGDSLNSQLVGVGPANGSVALNLDGSFTYTPNVNFTGTDFFDYLANDGVYDSIPARVYVQVGVVNDAPVALADNYSLDQGASLTTTNATGVLKNDSDLNGDPLNAVLTQDVMHGSLTLNPGGNFVYTPLPGFSGTDVFKYKANDGQLDSEIVRVVLTVVPTPVDLKAKNDSYAVAEDGILTVSPNGVLGNDSGPSPAAMTVSVQQSVDHGSLVLNSDGSFVYTPTANYNGPDQFIYTLSDGSGDTDNALVSLTVVGVGDDPVAVDDSYVVAEDTSLTLTSGNSIRLNDVDPDGGALTVHLLSGPSFGQLVLYPNGTFDYKGNQDFNGVDSFTYYVSNLNNNSAPATVTITVNPIADAPVARMNSYAALQNTPLTVNAPGVLIDDSDADGDSLTAILVGYAAVNGSVTLNPDGSFTYTPNSGFVGVDAFQYKANDGVLDSNTTLTRIFVGGVNSAPVALDDFYSGDENLDIVKSGADGVLANDSDTDGPGPLTAVLTQSPQHGTVTLGPNGHFTYSPNPGFSGVDVFKYKANDGELDSGIATVTLTINNVNGAPSATNDTYSTAEDTVLTINAPGVLANDFDGDSSDTLTATLIGVPDFGSVALNPDGSFVYTPKANFNSETVDYDRFSYRVSDGHGNTSTANVRIFVASVIDAPIAVDDTYTMLQGATFGNTWPVTVLANDTFEMFNMLGGFGGPTGPIGPGFPPPPPDAGTGIAPPPATSTGLILGTAQSIVILQDDVDHGVLNLDPMTGLIQYVPNSAFNGTDSFTYFIASIDIDDPFNIVNSSPATVTFNVQDTTVPPSLDAVDDGYTVAEDGVLTVSAPGVLSNDIAPIEADMNASVQSSTIHGSLNLQSDGSFVYTPVANYNGPDQFTYILSDATTASDVAVAYINVVPVGDAPIANDDTYTIAEDTTLTLTAAIGVRANDVNPDGTTMSVHLISGPSSGTLYLKANGSLDYMGFPNFFGTDSFTYYVKSASGTSGPATVTINVTPVQDIPVARMNSYAAIQDTPLTINAPGVLIDDTDADGDPLIAILDGIAAQNGAVTLNTDGSFTYTPNLGFTGMDFFLYHVNDGFADSATTRTRIFVGAVNSAPVALSDFYNSDENMTLSVNAADGVLKNDTDADGPSSLTVILVQDAQHGVLALNSTDGSFDYTPYPGFNGIDTFSYKVNDGQLDSGVATVTITINPVNDDPNAADDYYNTAEDTPLTIPAPGVLANDYDVDSSDTLQVTLSHEPNFGSVQLNPDGSFTYTPEENFNSESQGTVYFEYEVTDGHGGSSFAEVDIWVTSVIDHPVAVDDDYTLLEDTTIGMTSWPVSVLANDTFEESLGFGPSSFPAPLQTGAVPPPATSTGIILGTGNSYVVLQDDVDHGVLNLDPQYGFFEYTPDPDFSGTDHFTYFIATIDMGGFFSFSPNIVFSNTATVTFNVEAVNDAPVAVLDSFSTTEDQALTVAASGILSNDTDLDGDALTAILVNNPSNGNLALNANGGFTYTPNANFSGLDLFRYKANDGVADSNTTVVRIAVTPVDDPPVAVNDTYVASEDTTLTVLAPGVLQNDTDDSATTLTASLVVPPLHGTLVLNADGSFDYVANPNYFGADSFTYNVSDGTMTSNNAEVNITVTPVEDVPVGNPDNYSTQENAQLSVPATGVLANDTDADGDTLVAIQENAPASGSLAFPGDGSFIYQPNPGFNGVDIFTYRASDGHGTPSELTTVTITVGPVNDAPVANDDFYNVFEDQSTTVSAPGLLGNDTDLEDDVLSATLISPPINGIVVINEDGSFVYTPFADYNGTDTFTYQATDGLDNSNVATVTINVLPVDDEPLANEDFYVVDEDQFITVAMPGVLGNDSDADGVALIALLQQEPPHGQVALAGDGSFTYTPDPGYFGDDYFVYQANDGVSNSEPTTATIIVRPRNDRPVAFADSYVVAEDNVLSIAAEGILANDTDEDDDVLTASLEVGPLHGSLVLNADGSFDYTPVADYNGTDSFTYRANDGLEFSNAATVTITVTPVADAPEANDDNYSTPEDVPLVVAPKGVLGNDVDVDGDVLTALLVDNAANGIVSLNGDGSFTYTPNTAFNGTDTFTYQASDGVNVSPLPAAVVTITVGPVNDVPVANDDTYSLFEDTVATIPDPGVLQNDTDADPADTLTVSVITGPLYGTLALNPTGGFTYTPNADFTGTDSYTYQANDGVADSNVATVTLIVVEKADKPIANADSYSTTEELPLVVATPGVLGNDFDADGQVLISLLEDNPLNGTVELAGDGSFVYTPDTGFAGTDFFTYRANDGTQNSDKTTVTITVYARNDVPVGVDDEYNATEDAVLTIPATNGVLVNDTDADGDTLTAVIVNQTLNGSVVLNSDGSFNYTPNADFNGDDRFTYRAYDGQAYSTPPSTVIIHVAPVQDKPVGVADMYSIPEDKVLTVVAPGILGNDSDADGDTLTAILVDAPEHGIIQLNATGGFSYTPDENFFSIDTFTYYANDGTENSDLTTVTISVGGRNDGPVAVDDLYYTPEDVPLNIAAPGVLGNDVDDDGDMLQAVVITPPVQGSLVLNPDGSFIYTPNPSYYGEDQFVYRANDGTTLSNPATVKIIITPINDPPVLSNVMVTPALNENDTAVLTADLFDNDFTDTFLVSVNWGDGGAPTIMPYPAGTSKIFLTHQYLDDNPTATPVDTNVVVLTVQDNQGGSDSENRNVVVSNVAPNLENLTLTQVLPTGGQALLKGTITDVGTQDTFVLTVNWGDGNIEVTNHGPGTSPFQYIHTYAVPGDYTVLVTVQDDDGGIFTATPSLRVENTSDLILTKTANPDPASVGELLTYTMIVTNNGPDLAHNVILMDTLPTNVEVTSSTPALVQADGVLNWFLGDVPVGQTYRIDLIVKTKQQGPITNFATVISDEFDPNMENNTAAVTTTIGWLPDGPDLKADAVTVNTFCKLSKKGTKCKVKLWALVANRGNQDAISCVYSVYLSDDNLFSPTQDMKLKTKRLPKLKVGQVRAQRQTIKLPTGYTTTGKFMIVVLDEGNLVFEGNETNNLIIYGPLP